MVTVLKNQHVICPVSLKSIFLDHKFIEDSTLILSATTDFLLCAYLPYGAINRPGFGAGLYWIKKAEKR